jgi:hypothetical protein
MTTHTNQFGTVTVLEFTRIIHEGVPCTRIVARGNPEAFFGTATADYEFLSFTESEDGTWTMIYRNTHPELAVLERRLMELGGWGGE